MYKQNLSTSSGMWALWDYAAFEHVNDYQDWEALFCEDKDIAKQVAAHILVPVNLHLDGMFSFTVKVNDQLNERELAYLAMTSEPYLFHSTGKAMLSGLDRIYAGIPEEAGILLDLPEGDYSVTISLIRWDEEPGCMLDEETVSPDALSDFVLLIQSEPDAAGKSFRDSIDTFPFQK